MKMLNPDSPEAMAQSRQEVLRSTYDALSARTQGTQNFPVFLEECFEKRVWETERILSSGRTLGPVPFRDFVYQPFPVGLGTTYEAIERVISGDPALSHQWEEITGRTVPVAADSMPIASITIPDGRKRELAPAKVKLLADSIVQIGLLNPIAVTPDGVLIAGWHRLEACRSLGWETIPVHVTELDDLHRELAEIDENLVRLELTTLERSEHLQRRMQIYEALHPETKHGGAPGLPGGGKSPRAKGDTTPSFAQDTAQKTGRSERSIQRDVQIARDLDDETKAAVRGTPLEDRKTDLLDLARESDPERRHELAQKVLNGEAKSVRDAKGEKPTLVDQAFKLVERMKPAERLDFDRQIRPLIAAAEEGTT